MILEVPEISYTLNMKKAELAVHKVINNRKVNNKDAQKNTQALNYFEHYGAGTSEIRRMLIGRELFRDTQR
jgi:hypothetical protein